MEYRTGGIGRVFIVRFDDGDDLLESIKDLARKESIRAATIQLLGGMQCAAMVCGPKEPVTPPEPIWEGFSDGREVLGVGTLFLAGDEPAIHLHGAVGKREATLTGCIRKDAKVFLVVEAVIVELTGIQAAKVTNDRTGISMLSFD
ncbi:MAG TPA: DUF296 domain-containing protein [Nitrospirota bacterium]|jgi:predicted DNA-binding protein with PD1-like motif